MENTKIKRYKTTNTIRFQSLGPKLFFYAGLILGTASVLTIGFSIISHSTKFLGVAAVFFILSLLWLLTMRLISESAFGLSSVGFTEKGFIYFRSNAKDAPSLMLLWDDVREVGIEKTRWSYWIYVSDHKLDAAEKKEFPENAGEGVFYFNYAPNTWEEFITFVPEKFKAYLLAEKSAKKIR